MAIPAFAFISLALRDFGRISAQSGLIPNKITNPNGLAEKMSVKNNWHNF
jgi:hypothetical protein